MTTSKELQTYKTSQNGAVLHVFPDYPIDPPPSLGIPLLLVGIFLALHPVAWLLLSFFYEPWREHHPPQNENNTLPTAILILDSFAYWILEWTPQFTSKLLVLVLSACSMVVGIAFLRKGLYDKEIEINH
jgi:hypothetical protein